MNDDGIDSENFTLKKDLGTPLILHCSEIRKRLKIAMDVVPVLCAFLACIDHIGFLAEEGGKLFLLVHIYLQLGPKLLNYNYLLFGFGKQGSYSALILFCNADFCKLTFYLVVFILSW